MIEQKELRSRWGISQTTVRRHLKRYKAKPATFRGLRPVFSVAEIRRVEVRRDKEQARIYRRTARKLRAMAASRKGGGK